MSEEQSVVDQEAVENGKAEGRDWARLGGSDLADELGRLQQFRDRFSDDEWHAHFAMSDEERADVHQDQHAYPFVAVANAVDPDNATSRNDALTWWDSIGIEESDFLDHGFVRGFVEGALEAWSQFEDR